MKKTFITMIIMLLVLSIINTWNCINAVETEDDEYGLFVMYTPIGPIGYCIEKGEECQFISNRGSYIYVVEFYKENSDHDRTTIVSSFDNNFNASDFKVKSENEKVIKPKLVDGEWYLEGIEDGRTKIKTSYNYNGKEYTYECNWFVYSDMIGSRILIFDSVDVEMKCKEKKEIGVTFQRPGSVIDVLPDGYTEDTYFVANWESLDESIVKIVGASDGHDVTLEAVAPGEAEISCTAYKADGTGERVVKKIKVTVTKDGDESKEEDNNKEEQEKEEDKKDDDYDDTVVKDKYLPQTGEKILIFGAIGLSLIISICILIKYIKVYK